MFSLHFLSTHRSYHPENPTSIGRPRKVHLEAFSFIRHLLLIKWETCEIDVQELFWASIHVDIRKRLHDVRSDVITT